MRILLDTHSFLWFVADDPRLSQGAREVIEDGGNQCLLSLVSVWEMAIKHSIGKLPFAGPFDSFVPQQIEENDIDLLDIKIAHTLMVAVLPLHHRDPFDRLLIAQALSEDIPIVGNESLFDSYSVGRLW